MKTFYNFGCFRMVPSERQLLRNGSPVSLSSKTFDVLLVLLKNAGRLVEKGELLHEVWGDAYVEESNIAVTVSMLRKALGEDPIRHEYIQTVSKRGYRFIAPVKELGVGGDGLLASRPGTAQAAQTLQHTPAMQLYSEGRYFWNKRTEAGLLRSIECFQEAIRRDPRYAPAHAGLADSYALLASYGVDSPYNAHPAAKSAAYRALELDANSAEANTSLGMISFFYEWEWQQAEQYFQRALALNPGYALAHTWYAVQLAAAGRCDEAIEHVQLAHELDPLSLIINTEVGRVFYLCRKFDEAIKAFRRAIDLEPHFARAHSRLGMTYAAQRDFHEAIREFHKVEQLSGHDPYLDGLLGYCHASIGDEFIALELLKKLTREGQSRFVPAYSVALVCIGLMNRASAIEWLEKSLHDRSTYLVFAETDPLLDAMRADPRFQELVRAMREPQALAR